MRTLIVLAGFAVACAVARAQEPPALAPSHLKWIERAFTAGLTDPTGMTWIEIQLTDGGEPRWQWGWLAPAVEGREDSREERVVFLEATDWIPAPPPERRRQPARTFEEVSRAMANIGAPPPPRSEAAQDRVDALLRQADPTASLDGETPVPIAARVAWLHRLGRTDLAAALANTADLAAHLPGGANPSECDLAELLGVPLQERAATQALAAFIAGADEVALRCATRAARYARSDGGLGPGLPAEIRGELERRRAAGTLGVAIPTQIPADVAAGPVEPRVAWLIAQLDNCSGSSHMQLVLDGDWRVDALAAIGDAAVPALIDAIERDLRLSRVAVHPFTMKAYDDPTPALASVAEVALVAVGRIVGDIGIELSARDAASAKSAAAELRRYWAKHGGRPRGQRHYDLVKDPHAGPAERLAAARALAGVSELWDMATDLPLATPNAGGPNPAIAAFTAPTAAEAILAAMDRHVERGASDDDVEGYLDAVYLVNDPRSRPELVRRAANATSPPLHRIAIAHRLHHMGVREPLAELVAQLASGAFVLSPEQLRELIRVLVATGTAEGEAALRSFAQPEHPAYAPTLASLLDAEPSHEEEDRLTGHAYCLTVLCRALDDTTDTGWSFRIGAYGNLFEEERGRERVQSGGPQSPNGKPLRQHVAVRRCDRAAMVASRLLIGAPGYHPIFGDADERFAALRTFCQRYAGDAVRIPEAFGACRFLPRLPVLGRPATADDVAAGRAVFHLDGTGKGPVPGLVLPGVAAMTDAGDVYVVQAELDADGVAWYGVTRGEGWERVRGDRLVAPPQPLERGAEPHPVRYLHRSGPRR